MVEKVGMSGFWNKESEPTGAQPGSDPEKIPKPEIFPPPAIPIHPDKPHEEPSSPPPAPPQPDEGEPPPEKAPKRQPDEAPA